jgi:4a-hydroxytetrahydrobiopterin dehydratase
MTAPVPLGDDEIVARLAALPGWERAGNAITRTFAHTYHECLHLAMYVGAKAREVGHHPDITITWQRITFTITTHDAGDRLTEADFMLAAHIDAIAAGHGAAGVLSASAPAYQPVTRQD